MKKNLFFALVLISLISCSKEKVSEETPSGNKSLSINPSETSISFTGTGGSETLTISANFDWWIISKPEWIEVSTNGGSLGTTSLTVEADKNTKGKSRIGAIIVGNSSMLTASIEVYQNSLTKFWIYGDVANFPDQVPFQPSAWDGTAMRFSSTEGAHLPTIPDDVYFGLKTLIVDVSDASADCTLMIHNGWWSTTYADNVQFVNGPNEIQITKQIAEECAKGGEGKDLQLLLKAGNFTLNSVYYEE